MPPNYDDYAWSTDPTLSPMQESQVAEPQSPAGGCLLVLAVATLIFLVGAALEWFVQH